MKRTTQHNTRRAWLPRVLAVVAGLAFVATPMAAVPAQAEPVAISVTVSPNPAQTRIGESTSITVTLTNTGRQRSEPVQAAVSLSGIEQHADYTVNQGSCESAQGTSVSCGQLEPRAQTSFTVDINTRTDSGLAEGQTANGSLAISISAPNSGSSSATVTIVGVNQSAPGIQGKVTDLNESPVEGVKVAIKDSKGATFEATTGGDGGYAMHQPIAAGEMEVTFTKEGWDEKAEKPVAQTGQMLTLDVRMTEVKAEDEPSEEPEPEATTEAPAEDDDSLGPMMWTLIVLGALLVIGGIVAIVLLVRKGKSDDDDDDDSPLPDVPSSHKPHATQTGQLGVYDAAPRRPGMEDATMIHNGPLLNDNDLARYGSEPASTGFGPSYGESSRGSNDSTQMYPSSGAPTGESAYGSGPTSGAPGGSADSTRMYPTSDGPSSSGYGPTSGAGYGANPSSGAGYGAGPSSGAGYGANPSSGAGYGANPSSGAGYGANPSSGAGYGANPSSGAGYGANPSSGAGYGANPSSGAGYGANPSSGAGYGANPSSGAGYGANPASGSQQPGWDRGGYQPPSQAAPSDPASGQGWSGSQQSNPDWGQGHQGSSSGSAPSGGYGDRGNQYGDSQGQGNPGWGSSSQQSGWSSQQPAGGQPQQGGWGNQYGEAQGQAGGSDWSSRGEPQGGQRNWDEQRDGDWNRGGNSGQQRPRPQGDEGYDDRPQSW